MAGSSSDGGVRRSSSCTMNMDVSDSKNCSLDREVSRSSNNNYGEHERQ